jgi:hypothetical protein
MELLDFQELHFPYNKIGYWVNYLANFGLDHLLEPKVSFI